MKNVENPNVPKFLSDLYNGLRKYRGAFNELVLRTEKSREWNRLVLQGERKDEMVVKKAADLLAELTKENKEQTQRLAQYVKNKMTETV